MCEEYITQGKIIPVQIVKTAGRTKLLFIYVILTLSLDYGLFELKFSDVVILIVSLENRLTFSITYESKVQYTALINKKFNR